MNKEIGSLMGAKIDSSSCEYRLLIATACSLTHKEQWNKKFIKEYIPKYIYSKIKCSEAISNSIKSWEKSNPPWKVKDDNKHIVEKYYTQYENEVLIRVIPHAIVDSELDKLSKNVFLNTIYTHGNTDVIVGTIIYAYAINLLLKKKDILNYGEIVSYLLDNIDLWSKFPSIDNMEIWKSNLEYFYKKSYEEIWNRSVNLYKQRLIQIQEKINLGCIDFSGLSKEETSNYGYYISAIYISSRYAMDPNLAIKKAKNLKINSIVSLVGSFMGALYGESHIKENYTKNINEYKKIKNIISNLHSSINEDINSKELNSKEVVNLKKMKSAIRPVFMVSNSKYKFIEEINIKFDWYSGFSYEQKRRSLESFHKKIHEKYNNKRILEISTKSFYKIGIDLSAFNLGIYNNKNDNLSVECVFQSSKVFEHGGPYKELLTMSSKEAKKYPKLKNSGELKWFEYDGEIWGLEPKTLFYDWIYMKSLYEKKDYMHEVIKYDSFTDIEFNPKRSINCQARSAALFVSLYRRNLLEYALQSPENYKNVIIGNNSD